MVIPVQLEFNFWESILLFSWMYVKADLWSLKAALNNLSAFTIPPQNDLTKTEPENDDFDPFGSVNVKMSNPVANDCKSSSNDLMDDFFGSNSTPETVVPDPEIKGWFY